MVTFSVPNAQNVIYFTTFALRLMNCLSYSWPIKETK